MTKKTLPLDRDRFLRPFIALGFHPSEPGLLFPADLFIDLSGEELGKRLFLTSDAEGRDLCLRPEFTIPVCIDHLAAGAAARRADYVYFGRAFRQRPGASGEFWQGGVEAIGATDRAEEDARLLALAIDCARHHGVAAPHLRLGDVGLFRSVLDALDLPASWRRKFARAFGRSALPGTELIRFGLSRLDVSARDGLVSTLERSNPQVARALVADLLALGGLSPAGGRGIDEIAERFIERAESQKALATPPVDLDILQRFLAIEGPPGEALALARQVLAPLDHKIAGALDGFAARLAAIASAGLSHTDMVFSSAFGRNLDYYSGLVFELHAGADRREPPLIGGGRYDRLLTLLGAPAPVPAIGFSLYIERLGEGMS